MKGSERPFTQHDVAIPLHPHRAGAPLLGSDTALECAAAEDGSTTRDPCGATTRGLAALEHRECHSQRPPPHLQRPSKLGAALPKRAVLHIQSPTVHDTFGEAACSVVPAAPMSRTSLACVRLSKTNGALSSRYAPGARWITTGTPAVACSRPHRESRVGVVRAGAAMAEAVLVVEEGWAAGAAAGATAGL
eukprot:scaffold7915_cov62-Phaeocystis_antarctica.AAC.3